MKKSLKIVSYSPDLLLRHITALFFGDIRDSDAKFSYIISLCNETHIVRLHKSLRACLMFPKASLKYFILTIIIHKKLVAKRVKILMIYRKMRPILKKMRVLHQLSITPEGVLETFPGGTIYRNLCEKNNLNI